MASSLARSVTPDTVNGKNTLPRRRKNTEVRDREYLTEAEVETLIETAKERRHGLRDSLAILMAFRHRLRVSELVSLSWDVIHLAEARLDIRRRKNGRDSTHHLSGRELGMLRKLQREQRPGFRYIFVAQGYTPTPWTEASFRRMLRDVARAAGMPFPVYPHMLRHACGYKLANDGHDTRALQDYLGHKNIQHTARYTQLSPERFKGFWDDC